MIEDRPALVAVLALVGALALAWALGLPGSAHLARRRAAGARRTDGPDRRLGPGAQGDDDRRLPAEAPGETWGVGEVGEGDGASPVLVRYTSEIGWSLGPGLLDSTGEPLSGFRLDATRSSQVRRTPARSPVR